MRFRYKFSWGSVFHFINLTKNIRLFVTSRKHIKYTHTHFSAYMRMETGSFVRWLNKPTFVNKMAMTMKWLRNPCLMLRMNVTRMLPVASRFT
jgi:hypothetical protein